MFAFKKIVTPFLMPSSVLTMALLVGIVLLWVGQRQRMAKILSSTAALLLFLLSTPAVSGGLMRWLEGTQPPVLSPQAAGAPPWIVVLGGGHLIDPRLPPTEHLGVSAIARVLEGVRLFRAAPASKIVFSGGYPNRGVSHAEAMARVAEIMGVPRSQIALEEISVDTETEVEAVRPWVGDARFYLVTSAHHMKRALALFRKSGFDPIPAPAGFFAKGAGGAGFLDALPTRLDAGATDLVARESLGYLWSSLRGRL